MRSLLIALGLTLMAGSAWAQAQPQFTQPTVAALPDQDLIGKPVVDLDARIIGTITGILPGPDGRPSQVLIRPTNTEASVAVATTDLLLIVPDQLYVPILDSGLLAVGSG